MQLAYEQEYYRIQDIVKKNNKRAIKGDGLQALLKDIVDSNVSLNYSTKRNYIPGCVAVYDGDFYVCTSATSGLWDATAWLVINWSLWHPYTEDYEARVVAAGDTLDGTRKTYIDDFFVAITSHLSKIIRLNMFLSDTFTGFNVPLIYNTDGSATPIGNATDTNNNFVSGDWGVTTGLVGDAATKYLDTGINPSTTAELGLNDTSVGAWVKTINNGRMVIGAISGSDCLALAFAYTGYTGAVLGNINDSYGSNSYPAQTAGLVVISRTVSTEHKLYKNGSNTGTFVYNSNVRPNDTLKIFRREAGTLSNDTLYGYIIAKGLDATANSDIYNAWAGLNTDLGR